MEKRTIVITGTSTLNVKTDYINIRFHIDKLDISYKKSLSLLTEQVSKITDILYKEGFLKEDLKTSDFNIRKDTRYDDKKKQYVFLGYRVTETLTLSFPIDNQKINSILSEIWKELNNIEFDISFSCHNPNKYEDQLIKLAAKDAKEKAELISESLGVKLKQIARIDYSFSQVHIEHTLDFCYDPEGSVGSLPDMNPEDTNLNKTITVVWEIE